ncbi:hypothetical protein FB550_12183 [Neobacillus bataviensis]|uniref:Uncharacterized protein n=1 Tax=Neobacillus bataviensis TaxID=220685 RepID=A0A561CKB7_9BACI|nr:hypothetical protein FB550_12183 [Neobacillus bataviensis]
MFNEYEVYQMMKLRKEDVERNAQNAWKLNQLQQDFFFDKLVKNLKSRPKSPLVNTNCNCVCCC